MIAKIAEAFVDTTDGDWIDPNFHAEFILTTIEKAGMQPPSYEGLIATGEKYVREEHFARDTMTMRTWEPE